MPNFDFQNFLRKPSFYGRLVEAVGVFLTKPELICEAQMTIFIQS